MPYLAFGFDDPLAAGNHWWGVFVRVPESPHDARAREPLAQGAQPAAAARGARLALPGARRAATVDDGQLVLAVRRATSDLASVEGFYGALRANATLAEAGADNASARCYLWAHAAVDVCFVERAANATAGDFSVADFADMLFGAHEAILGDGKQNCGRDKWADLHYAYDAVTETSEVSGSTLDQMSEAVQEGQFDYILDYVESASSPYSCFGSHIHYIFDPTGWAIQLNVNFSRTMDGCSWRDSNASGYGISNFCWNGVCDAAVATESQSATHTHSHKHASHAGLHHAEQEMSLAEDAAAAGGAALGFPLSRPPSSSRRSGSRPARGERRRYRRIPEGRAPPCDPNLVAGACCVLPPAPGSAPRPSTDGPGSARRGCVGGPVAPAPTRRHRRRPARPIRRAAPRARGSADRTSRAASRRTGAISFTSASCVIGAVL